MEQEINRKQSIEKCNKNNLNFYNLWAKYIQNSNAFLHSSSSAVVMNINQSCLYIMKLYEKSIIVYIQRRN